MGKETLEDDYGYRFRRPLHHRPAPDAIVSGLTSPSLSQSAQEAAVELPEPLRDLGPEEREGFGIYAQTGGAALQGGVELGAA